LNFCLCKGGETYRNGNYERKVISIVAELLCSFLLQLGGSISCQTSWIQ